MNKKKFLSGSLYLTIASIVIKLLSVLYLIPFNKLLSDRGATLFSYGYVPYTIFLSLTTAGIPMGISRIVARYKAIGDHSTAYKMYRIGQRSLTFLGIIGFFILFFLSDVIAAQEVGKDADMNIHTVSMIIKLAAVAIIFVPSLSIQTGFLQAHHDMKSITNSQISEHAFRLLFIIGFAYLVTNPLIGYFESYEQAVDIAIYGAMLAATFAAWIALWITYKNVKKYKQSEYKNVLNDEISKEERVTLARELYKICIPTIIISLDLPLYQQIDQLSYVSVMDTIGLAKGASTTLSLFAFNAFKIAMVITTITSSFNYPLTPAIAESHSLGSYDNLRYTATIVISLVMFITTPVMVFIMLWSEDVYNVFYEISVQGSTILIFTVLIIYIWSLYSILDNIMVGINKAYISVMAIIAGLIAKLIIQYPLILALHEFGMITSTIIGVSITYAILIYNTKKLLKMSFATITSIQFQIIGLVLFIAMPLKFISSLIPYVITSKIMSVMWLGIWFTIFFSIYLYVQNKYKLVKFLFDYDGSLLGLIKNKILRR